MLARFDPEAAARKLACVEVLADARLPTARAVGRLHGALCFLHAYPDDARLFQAVERVLAGFARRADLRRHRAALEDTGIAGTDIRFSFFAPMAGWLARRCPGALSVDWRAFESHERLKAWLEPLLLEAEVPAFYDAPLDARAWVEHLRGPEETDGAFLVRAFADLDGSDAVRRRAFEDLGVVLRIRSGPSTPTRTGARWDRASVTHRTAPLRGRPDLAAAVGEPPRAVRSLTEREGRELIDLAREAMVTRSRDLDSFAFGDPRDVRLVDCGDGLAFAVIGLVPEQRIVLEGLYAFLTLQNGVPIGYVLASALFGSSEIAYNVFESFRGAEAGHVYGRVLATARALLGSDTFTVYPYQLGHGNSEGLASGAWWFYQRLGFRARDPGVLRIMRAELAAQRREPGHRSNRATLKKLARHNVYWSLGAQRDDVIGLLRTTELSLALSSYVANRFGSARRRARRVMRDEAAARIGARDWKRWKPGERAALERWSPLLLNLPDLEAWSTAERRALVRVVRAKGGQRESDYVRLFDAHTRLRRAVTRLMLST